MSRARSVSQLVGANTALGNTVITGTANVSSTLAAGNTTITGFANVSGNMVVTGTISTNNTLTITDSGFASRIDLVNTGAGGNTFTQFSTSNAFSQGGGKWILYNLAASGSYFIGCDTAGRVTMPYQPAFMAVVPTEKSLTGGADNNLTDHFTSTTYNIGGHYSTSNGRFTAPVAGLYHFVADLYVYTCSTCEIYFKINGSIYIRSWDKPQGLNVNPSGNRVSYQVSLSAGDYVTLSAIPNQNAALWNGGPYSSRFTGCLLH